MIDWLNDNAGAVQGIAVITLVAVTAWYAWSNARLVHEVREQSRPYMTLDFEMTRSTFDVAILNLGNRPASDVRFRVTRDIAVTRQFSNAPAEVIKFSELGPIKKGFPYFPPNRRLLFSFSWGRELLGKDRTDEQLALEVEVSYRYDRTTYTERFPFDLSIYREGVLYRSFGGGDEDMSRQLRDIAWAVKELKTSRGVISGIDMINTTWCKVCGEKVSKSAKKCPHCHEWLSEEAAARKTEGNPPKRDD